MRETSSLSYLFYLFAFWYSLSDKFISFVRYADIVCTVSLCLPFDILISFN